MAFLHRTGDHTSHCSTHSFNLCTPTLNTYYSDVAMAIVKHDKWRSAMRHTHRLDRRMNQQTTPMRELIKKMPGQYVCEL